MGVNLRSNQLIPNLILKLDSPIYYYKDNDKKEIRQIKVTFIALWTWKSLLIMYSGINYLKL